MVQGYGKRLNAKPSDPVATDKSGIEQELQSGSSILVTGAH